MNVVELPSGILLAETPDPSYSSPVEPPLMVDPLHHEASADGEECCVAHMDDDHERGCWRCRYCREWVRPLHLVRRCPARS